MSEIIEDDQLPEGVLLGIGMIYQHTKAQKAGMPDLDDPAQIKDAMETITNYSGLNLEELQPFTDEIRLVMSGFEKYCSSPIE